jgi:hypothetical protein
MTLQFQCIGCNHERTEPESEHARKGICVSCDAKGVGLKQIKKVEKWEARDGSFHDSLAAAEKYQLHRELQTALKTCEGYCDRQATHLLSHFDIVRKGDPLPGLLRKPATVQYHKAPETVCTTCYLVSGAVIGCLLTLAIIWFR